MFQRHIVLLLFILAVALRPVICVRRKKKVTLASEEERKVQEEVAKFNDMALSWQNKSKEGISIKLEVEEAFETLSNAVRMMEKIPKSIPTNPKPIELASMVLLYAQLPVHYYSIYRLLVHCLKTMEVSEGTKKAMILKELCQNGGPQSTIRRATCHDSYALLCASAYLSGKKRITEQCVQEFNFLHSSQMPPSTTWSSAKLITRQLPGVNHIPWWNAALVPWKNVLFQPIWKHHLKIQQEVLMDMNLKQYNIEKNNDIIYDDSGDESVDLWTEDTVQNYGTNSDWDSTRSYDRIILFYEDKWNVKACLKFKVLCTVLRDKKNQKLRNGFQELLSARNEEIWHKTTWNYGFRTYPPLGISLHRVWPGARAKPHLGPAARLVSSIALSAPAHSTITVGDLTRLWNTTHSGGSCDSSSGGHCSATMEEDENENESLNPFFVYDDSFLFSVNNDLSQADKHSMGTLAHQKDQEQKMEDLKNVNKAENFLVYLSFYTWHPDLLRAPGEQPDKKTNMKFGEEMKFTV